MTNEPLAVELMTHMVQRCVCQQEMTSHRASVIMTDANRKYRVRFDEKMARFEFNLVTPELDFLWDIYFLIWVRLN